jgi:hypothetical protein
MVDDLVVLKADELVVMKESIWVAYWAEQMVVKKVE